MHRLAVVLLASLVLAAGCTGSVDDVAADADAAVSDTAGDTVGADASEDSSDGAVVAESGAGEDSAGEGSVAVDEEPLEDAGDDEDVTATTPTTVGESDESTTTAVAASGGLSQAMAADLQGVLDITGDLRFTYPFFYADATQTCDGCEASVQLYFAPDPDDAKRRLLSKVFVDGVEVGVNAAAPSLREHDPIFVAERLIEAAQSGVEISYEINPVTGLASSWTIADESVTLTCLEGDTRPIDFDGRPLQCGGTILN